MAGGYGQRWRDPLGARDDAMGGAAANLSVEALLGQGDMVTVFDDFNGVVGLETFGDVAIWETSGWVLTDVGAPAADAISMNSAATATLPFDSCIRINAGTAADTGGNAQLDKVNASLPASMTHPFPHLWIPESGAGAAVLDNTDWVFACRIGFITNDTTAGAWDGKVFIGLAEAGDTGILVPGTGIIDVTTQTGPMYGFHVNETGVLRGISQRTVNTAFTVANQNFVGLGAAGSVNSTLANGVATIGDPVWFDLALRIRITDMSDNANNGSTSFYWRRVPGMTPAPGSQDFTSPFQTVGTWNTNGVSVNPATVTNTTPNNDIALVPTIEVVNGPTQLSDVLVDWWVFGCSRYSRTRKL